MEVAGGLYRGDCIGGKGLYRGNGKENGSFYLGFKVILLGLSRE